MHGNWVQKSLENATCHPFGTKSRPGRLHIAPGPKTITPKSTFWAENVGPGADYGSDLGPQMAPKTGF